MGVTIWTWQCPQCGTQYRSHWLGTGRRRCACGTMMTYLPPGDEDLVDCGDFKLRIVRERQW